MENKNFYSVGTTDETFKRLIIYISDRAHAELRLNLECYGITEQDFFRAFILMLNKQHPGFMKFFEEHQKEFREVSLSHFRRINVSRRKEEKLNNEFGLTDEELAIAFDVDVNVDFDEEEEEK